MTLLKNRQVLAFVAAAVFGLAVLAALLTLNINRARGALTADQPSLSNQFRSAQLLATTTINGSTVLTTNATSTNATSTNQTAYSDSNNNGAIWDGSFDVRGAKHVDVYFTRGGVFGAASLGTSTFHVQGWDGEQWQYVDRLLNATTSPTASFGVANGVYGSDPNLGAANIVTIGDKDGSTVDATTTRHFIIDETALNYQKLRCIATRTVDGSNSCQFTATF